MPLRWRGLKMTAPHLFKSDIRKGNDVVRNVAEPGRVSSEVPEVKQMQLREVHFRTTWNLATRAAGRGLQQFLGLLHEEVRLSPLSFSYQQGRICNIPEDHSPKFDNNHTKCIKREV